jgi:ParB-like chromosome segregation protein Spo0J
MKFTGEIHPVADLFPLIEGDEFDQLVDSVATAGLMHPLVLDPAGVLLDGRNRLRACEKAGVAPRFVVYEGDDITDYVVRVNIQRRHLTPGQRDFLALDLLPHYEREAKIRQGHGRTAPGKSLPADQPEALPRQESRDAAAKAVGGSGRGVSKAKRVSSVAPDLEEKVRSGEMALDTAEKQAARRQKEQSEQSARKVKLSNVTADAEGERWRLLYGDFRERFDELGDGTVDLILTDPPYPEEFMHLWSDLSKVAARVLKPQGLLVALTGQIYLPDVMRRLGEHLSYGWCYCQPLPGQNSRIMGRHIAQTWKPWLAYSNGKWPSGLIDWHEDTTDPSKASKTYRWEQGAEPADYLIANLSPPGAVIVDPFTGTGTYGVSALRQGRTFIGCEADSERFTKAAERLA